jgi:hypothetical protein
VKKKIKKLIKKYNNEELPLFSLKETHCNSTKANKYFNSKKKSIINFKYKNLFFINSFFDNNLFFVNNLFFY